MMEIYLAFFIFGLLLVIVLASLGMIGDFDSGDADVDVDVDVDMDIDMDVDMDVDMDIDMDVDMDVDADAGGDTGLDGGAFDADSGHPTGSISPMSPFIVGFFFFSFGSVGMVLEERELLDTFVTFGAALGGAVVITGFFRYCLTLFFIKSQASSLVTKRDFIGQLATVLVAIPGGDRTGSIRVETKDGLKQKSARASHPIARKDVVRIKYIVGRIYFVEKVHGMEPKNVGIEEQEEKSSLLGKKKNKEAKSGLIIKPPQTVIYDQRNIEIKDSVVQRTDFGHNVKEDEKKEQVE